MDYILFDTNIIRAIKAVQPVIKKYTPRTPQEIKDDVSEKLAKVREEIEKMKGGELNEQRQYYNSVDPSRGKANGSGL